MDQSHAAGLAGNEINGLSLTSLTHHLNLDQISDLEACPSGNVEDGLRCDLVLDIRVGHKGAQGFTEAAVLGCSHTDQQIVLKKVSPMLACWNLPEQGS